CYETTDRHGRAGRETGLAEDRRYLEACRARADGRFAGLVGAHASFTLKDESLEQLAGLAREFESGVHIHVAEDPCDESDCRQRSGIPLIERLERHGVATERSVFAHGTHLNAAAIARVNELRVTMAHNARSNMHNAVGYAPVAQFTCPVMLGTDGIGADMLAEARAAWFVSRHAYGGLSPMRILAMLAESARRASRSLGVTLGRLEADAAADIVVTDYVPSSPLDSTNLVGHMLFGLTARHVRDVMVGGQWVVREKRLLTCDERAERESAVGVARGMWERMSAI
ncbi:chlorohydrolase, partial [Chloroflexi bacterium CFX5]|nr:chlorohydrolase [Chloroflexi bacterium CFX5]